MCSLSLYIVSFSEAMMQLLCNFPQAVHVFPLSMFGVALAQLVCLVQDLSFLYSKYNVSEATTTYIVKTVYLCQNESYFVSFPLLSPV